ncbi:MAG: hypothetical protein RIQ53_190 [Pseudomonadota bacterium]|jgi:hypothetical protein
MHRTSPVSAPGRWPRPPHTPAPGCTAPRHPTGAGPALALLAGLALGGCGTARMPQGEERADLQRPQMRMAGPTSAMAGEATTTTTTTEGDNDGDDGRERGLIAISVSGDRETQDAQAEGGANGLGALVRTAAAGHGGSTSGSSGSTGSTSTATVAGAGGVVQRVRVSTPAVYLRLPLGRQWTLEGAGSAQRSTGVTPTWYTDTDSLRSVDERRRTADARLTRSGSHHALSLGVHGAQDDDSRARGMSLQGHWDSQDHHSRFHLGLAWTEDTERPAVSGTATPAERQLARAVQLGLTQTLGPHDVVQLEWTGSLQRGDLDDPDLAYDVRPDSRQAQALQLRWNHWLGFAALKTGWRLYADDWGVRAHTLEAAMAFPMGADNRSTITPEVRWTTQSAAHFYVPWNGASIIYPVPTRHWNGYTTLDPRLAAWGALGVAIKVDAALDADWNASLKLGVQRQQAGWRLLDEGSGGLAPLTTWSWQAGLRRAF